VPRACWHLHWQLPGPRLAWLQKNDQDRVVAGSFLDRYPSLQKQE
jgi:hypothetical protein